jgi:hypothetical protein
MKAWKKGRRGGAILYVGASWYPEGLWFWNLTSPTRADLAAYKAFLEPWFES